MSELLEYRPVSHFVYGLLHCGEVAKGAAGGSGSSAGFLGLQFQMRAQFPCQFVFGVSAGPAHIDGRCSTIVDACATGGLGGASFSCNNKRICHAVPAPTEDDRQRLPTVRCSHIRATLPRATIWPRTTRDPFF